MSMKKFKIPGEDIFLKKLSLALFILIVLILAGSVINYNSSGDHGESGNFQDSILYTVALITHANIEEVHESYFFLMISLLGYVTQFYILYVILEFMLEGKLKSIFSEVKMFNKIKGMKNHYVVCGGGRVGKNVAKELIKYKMDYVIIEADKERVERLKNEGLIAFAGDCLDETDLDKAGIMSARYMCACLGDDGDNILLVLTAKEHNPELRIAARACREKTINKLRHAGANHIILPEVIGGLQIAHSVVRDELNMRRANQEPIPSARGLKE